MSLVDVRRERHSSNFVQDLLQEIKSQKLPFSSFERSLSHPGLDILDFVRWIKPEAHLLEYLLSGQQIVPSPWPLS